MRVVTWNVRDLLGDPLVVSRVLRDLAPDVVCLQEVPRRAFRGFRLQRLARDSGLAVLGGGRGSGGTAVLGAPGTAGYVQWVRVLPLPVPRWWTRRRGAVLVRLRPSGWPFTTPLTVVSVHLPLTAQDRLSHARLVVDALSVAVQRKDFLVIAGDLNEPPDHPAWHAFEAVVVDPDPDAGPTFPARAPGTRLDAVLVDRRFEVVRYGVPDVDAALVRIASDHWPVVADLAVGTGLRYAGPRP